MRHVAAKISAGLPMLGTSEKSARGAGDVIMLNYEDGAEDVVLPSLIAEGADLDRIERIRHVITMIAGKEEQVHFGPVHLARLQKLMTERKTVRLVLIDPIASFVGRSKIDDHKQSELRQVLDPLSELAEATGAIVMAVAHVNKGNATKAIHRICGSTAYSNTVRIAYMVEDHSDHGRLLMPAKQNVVAVLDTSIPFRLVPLTVDQAAAFRSHPAMADVPDDKFSAVVEQMPHIEFDEPIKVNANEVMAAGNGRQPANPERRQECLAWILAFLSRFAFLSDEVFAAASKAGFRKKLVYDVREEHNNRSTPEQTIGASRMGVKNGKYWWCIGDDYTRWIKRPDGEDGIADDQRRAAADQKTRENTENTETTTKQDTSSGFPSSSANGKHRKHSDSGSSAFCDSRGFRDSPDQLNELPD
jgi:hypothetical protein